MFSKFINNKDFHFNFFEKRTIPSPYNIIRLINNEELDLTHIDKDTAKRNVLLVELFPTIFIPNIENPIGFELKKYSRQRDTVLA